MVRRTNIDPDMNLVDGELATCDMVRLELLYRDRIAGITGQPTRRLAPKGTLR